MVISSSRRIENFGHLGRQFRDMLTYLGYTRDPEVSCHSYRTDWGDERFRVKMVIYPRGEEDTGYRYNDKGEDGVDAVIRVVHRAMHHIAGHHQDELKHSPFRYFVFRIMEGPIQQNREYMEEDDPTIIHMASLTLGLERHLADTTSMLEETRRRLEYYQGRVETLEERLVEANTTLLAVHEAREAAEAVAGQGIVVTMIDEAARNATVAMDDDDHQEMPPENLPPPPPQRMHPRMKITRKKQCLQAKKRRLTRQAIAPSSPLALPAPPTREEQIDDTQGETNPEEGTVATPDETTSASFQLHFAPAPTHPYDGPEQHGYLDE